MYFRAWAEVNVPLLTASLLFNFPIVYHFKKNYFVKAKPVILFKTEQDKFLMECPKIICLSLRTLQLDAL